MEALSKQDLHHLAMNHVGKELEKQGFEFVTITAIEKTSSICLC